MRLGAGDCRRRSPFDRGPWWRDWPVFCAGAEVSPIGLNLMGAHFYPEDLSRARRARGPCSEIDADASHQLTRWDELVTRGAHTKYVGKARVNAILVGQILANQLDPPVGVGR